MQPVAWFIPGMGDELVEFVILLIADLALLLEPEGLHVIYPLAIQQDREGHKIRITLEDGLDPAFGGVFRMFLFQLDHDTAAAGLPRHFPDLVATHAIAGPAQVFRILLPRMGEDAHFFSHHENTVKAHPKAPYHIPGSLRPGFQIL